MVGLHQNTHLRAFMEAACPLIHPVSPSPPQGFPLVCEAARSDSSSSPAAGEQSCPRGNSVEKGGPSQQPPPVKGPSKKK